MPTQSESKDVSKKQSKNDAFLHELQQLSKEQQKLNNNRWLPQWTSQITSRLEESPVLMILAAAVIIATSVFLLGYTVLYEVLTGKF